MAASCNFEADEEKIHCPEGDGAGHRGGLWDLSLEAFETQVDKATAGLNYCCHPRFEQGSLDDRQMSLKISSLWWLFQGGGTPTSLGKILILRDFLWIPAYEKSLYGFHCLST